MPFRRLGKQMLCKSVLGRFILFLKYLEAPVKFQVNDSVDSR